MLKIFKISILVCFISFILFFISINAIKSDKIKEFSDINFNNQKFIDFFGKGIKDIKIYSSAPGNSITFSFGTENMYKIRKYVFKSYDTFISEEKRDSINPGEYLKIETFVTDINIFESRDNELKYDFSAKVEASEWEKDRPELLFDAKKNILKIKWPEKLASDKIKIESKIDIYIPESVKEINIISLSGNINSENIKKNKLDISTTSGTISIKEIISENLEIKNTSGDIYSDIIKSSNSEINNISGSIKIKDIKSSKLSISSVSGGIFIKETTKNTDINSVSGNIGITINSFGPSDISIDTISGNVSINTEQKKEIRSELSTISGDISVNEDFSTIAKKSSKTIVSRKHDIKDEIFIKATTVSGNIEIK